MRVAALSSHRVDAYLTHLGVPSVRCDATGLAALQAAHLMRVPFHNLFLLANDGRPWSLQSLAEVVDGAIWVVHYVYNNQVRPATRTLEFFSEDL